MGQTPTRAPEAPVQRRIAEASPQTPQTPPPLHVDMGAGIPSVDNLPKEGVTPNQEPPKEGAGHQPVAPAGVEAIITQAQDRRMAGDLVMARDLLNKALASPETPESRRSWIRSQMQALNEDLIFSPKPHPGETLTGTYTVQSGDSMVKIVSRQGLAVHYRLLARVNRLSSPNRISAGQTLKTVKGPFHAVVTKSAYRMDVYAGPPDEPESWVYIRSFTVGLGEGDSTPVGEFVVRRNSKLEDPFWVNPRTGERFDASDPKNPIGEFWIGLEGVGESATLAGYGVHGTIEPASVGQMRSMGCVRLLPDDIALVYELLEEQVSHVRIVR